ncbi:hypothetical protein QAD11_12555 [Stenotrophomonas maltophilia]|jgi:GMP synthase (glutamine-hydrolysing)|nr:hypothetical protein [Stenotrophomonas maltophilia]MDH7619420.1 hypothetical protein [Stenotrophomonas maltophilia]
MKHAVVLQHVGFEDLGTLQPLLLAQGWQLQLLQAGVDALDDAETADLLVVLGGPISANDTGTYPSVNDSIACCSAGCSGSGRPWASAWVHS